MTARRSIRAAALGGAALLLACASPPAASRAAAPARVAGAPVPAAPPPPPPATPWVRTPPPPPLPAAPVPAPVVREVTLANGLRVVAVEHHRRPVVVLRLLLPRGALTDPESMGGLTFLSLALATDYYERSPETGEELVDEKSLRREFIELGGAADFDVGFDSVALGASGYASDAGAYLRLLARAVTRPRHGEHTFSARRDALLDAIEDLESSDPEALGKVVGEAAFGRGHPYARSLIGTRASLRPLGVEDVIAHQERLLVPRGATLLVVGDVRAEQVLAEARAAFGRWSGEALPAPAVPAPAVPGGPPEVGYLRRQPASTLVACATRPLADVRASDAALEVLATVLGHGPEGRLGAELRERAGLTYDASAVLVRRRGARALVACSPLRGARADEGLRRFREVLEAARQAPPSVDEVRRAQAVRLAEVEGELDHAAGLAAAWEEAITLGTGIPRLEQERAAIARVTPDELHRIAREALRPETLRWILSGDARDAARAADANRMGRLRTLALDR